MKNPAIVSRLFGDKKLVTALFMLPKPGIVLLSLVAGWTGIWVASKGHPSADVVLWTTLGLGFATAGACVFNNVIDRDIDSVMQRTQKRSLPSGEITPVIAKGIGAIFVILSLFITQIYLGFQVMLITGLAIFIYVILYSLYLKRTTPMATHIGGISGALPPIIGYAAANGRLDFNAFILFLIIVVWQQPHFWALALKYREDYAKAGVPTLPVAMGVWATKVRLFWWTLALVPVSILPYCSGMSGSYYLWSAIILTAAYNFFTIRFIISSREKEMFLFFFSVFYLGLLFCIMVLDMN